MPLYTFVMDYAGGTYVSQISADSPDSAFVLGANSLEPSQIFQFGPKAKNSLVEQLKQDEHVALDGLLNVWCATAIVRGKLVIINLIQTEINK